MRVYFVETLQLGLHMCVWTFFAIIIVLCSFTKSVFLYPSFINTIGGQFKDHPAGHHMYMFNNQISATKSYISKHIFFTILGIDNSWLIYLWLP